MNPAPTIVKTATPTVKRKRATPAKPASPSWKDPFIGELHETRRKLLAKAGNNMHQLIQNAHQAAVLHGFVVETTIKK